MLTTLGSAPGTNYLFFDFYPESASIFLENKSHAMPAFKIKNLGYGGYLKGNNTKIFFFDITFISTLYYQ